MKRILPLLLALCALMTAPVYADLIYVPESDFMEDHYDECTYVNRLYWVNGGEGYALLQKSPVDDQLRAAALNGTKLRVHFTCDSADGVLGLVEYVLEGDYAVQAGSSERQTGWVPMADLTVVYDDQAFQEEFAADLTDWDGDLRQITRTGDTVFWTYPGSGTVNHAMPVELDIQFDKQYTDDEGQVWGHVGYYRAMRGCWVCLDDPAGAVRETTLDRTPTLTPAAAPPADVLSNMGGGSPALLVGGGLAALCAGLAAWFLKGRKHP